MKYIASLSFLILVSLSSFDAIAVGLQDYLQNASATTEEATQVASTLDTSSATSETNNPLNYIIELVVAGIVASALIISVLVLFLGRWTANREKKIIKALRVEAEQEKDNIISAAASVREKEKETVGIVSDMQDKAKQLTQKITVADENNEKILEVTEKIIKHEKELTEVTEHVSTRMDDIQDYWKGQLEETVSTISQVQQGLDKNLNVVDEGIETMQRQKDLSQDLLQDFLSKHQEQGTILKNNSNVSEQLTESLEETFKESNKLLELLKLHQKTAEKSLNGFTQELTVYEEQAYEQFDTTFQVADLARQELTANIDESRKHIETMRRHEEQSHNINTQTQKNLELLDYSKIMKLSTTLDSTHDMFTDIRSRVDETKIMLDELKDIESDIKEKSALIGSVELSNSEEIALEVSDSNKSSDTKEEKESATIYDTDYKMASGDFTPLSFFTNIKSNSSK
jgi:hypothetical protein